MPRARLAIEVFVHRIRKYIGAYAAVLGGADAIVFTGGIGENSVEVRAAVSDALVYMGVVLDAEKNQHADARGRGAWWTSPRRARRPGCSWSPPMRSG